MGEGREATSFPAWKETTMKASEYRASFSDPPRGSGLCLAERARRRPGALRGEPRNKGVGEDSAPASGCLLLQWGLVQPVGVVKYFVPSLPTSTHLASPVASAVVSASPCAPHLEAGRQACGFALGFPAANRKTGGSQKLVVFSQKPGPQVSNPLPAGEPSAVCPAAAPALGLPHPLRARPELSREGGAFSRADQAAVSEPLSAPLSGFAQGWHPSNPTGIRLINEFILKGY